MVSKAGGGAIETLLREARADLAARADPDYAIRLLVATEGLVLGVRVPEVRRLVRDFLETRPEIGLDEAAAFMDRVARSGGRDEMLFGIFLLASFRRSFTAQLWPRLVRWTGALDNWETCDQLALGVGGELVARDLSLVARLCELADSSDRWQRRFAVAATVPLNHAGRAHPEATLRVCEMLLGDGEEVVRKAVAWAIREAGKADPKAIAEFLRRRRAKMPPGLLREASKKLPATLRKCLLSDCPAGGGAGQLSSAP